MKKAPKIGQRVRYKAVICEGEQYEEVRTCEGVVTKLYPKHDDVFDDDGEFVRRGPLLPERDWKVCIKVDQRPKWWPYPNNDVFCPDVAELEDA
jgi:hypothetical protein